MARALSEDRDPSPPPTAVQLFMAFAKIGLTSFGGGLSGWLLRDFVQNRRWISEEEFMNGMAVSQALPGINVTNMAIWLGYRLQGPLGAAIGFLGILLPSSIIILILGVAFAYLADLSPVQIALSGAAAAAVGLPLQLGLSAALRVRRAAIPLAVLAVTFVLVAVFRVPLIWAVLIMGAISITAEYIRIGRPKR